MENDLKPITHQPQKISSSSDLSLHLSLQSALTNLNTSPNLKAGKLNPVLSEIQDLLTQYIKLKRVSFWQYYRGTRQKPERLQCIYPINTLPEEKGPDELIQPDAPVFFEALNDQAGIYANDAQTNAHTIELKASYLEPQQIRALLGVQIYHRGNLWGVILLEKTEIHHWQIHESLFAQAAQGFISHCLAASERQSLQEELDNQEEQFMESYLAEMNQMADSTNDKQQEHEAHIRQILDALPVGVFVLDKEAKPFYANPESQRILGKTHDAEHQFSLNDLNHSYPAYKAGTQDIYPADQHPINRALRGECVEINDMEIHHPDKILSLQVNASPIKDEGGYTNFAIAVYSDISHMKQAEAELIEARKKAEDANQAKGQFLANMSHEIRTPMNAIIGLSYLFTKTHLNAKQSDYLHKIQNAAQNLLGIINDILDFSKIDANMLQMEHTPFELGEILNNLSSLLGLKAQQKDIELILHLPSELPIFVMGDPLRLEQILINLINNALKFTSEGMVSLIISTLHRDPQRIHLQFEIRDTGIGISPEQQAKLFNAFSQADSSTTRQFGGTGLGLTISKQLINLMEGDIWVESETGQGSSFIFDAWFDMPEDLSLNQQIRIAPENLGPLSVLVIDDQAIVLEILKDYLVSFGFEVTTQLASPNTLKNMIEALKQENPYDLLLVDWKMPQINGIELLKACWEQHTWQSKSILMTSYGREDVLTQVGNEFIDGLVLKPITPSQLFDTIIHVFSDQAAQDYISSIKKNLNSQIDLSSVQGAHILLVEDNPINQQVAQELLTAEGFIIDIANNGQEALDVLRPNKYDLILIDLQMPVLDGYATTRRIRENADYNNLPIIAMTADAIQGIREKALASGMNDYVTKPIELNSLFTALKKWLPYRSAQIQTDASHTNAHRATEPAHTPKELPNMPNMPNLPGVEVDEALARLAGNEGLYLKLLKQFSETLPETLHTIETALKQARWKKVEHELHTLKGTAANLGLSLIQEIMNTLELSLQNRSFDQLIWQSAKSQLESFILKLNLEITHTDEPAEPAQQKVKTAHDPQAQQKLVDDFEEALTNYDPAAGEILIKLQNHYTNPTGFHRIQSEIDNFDFDSALDLWKELRAAKNT